MARMLRMGIRTRRFEGHWKALMLARVWYDATPRIGVHACPSLPAGGGRVGAGMMNFQNVPAVLPIAFAALLSGGLTWFAWRRRERSMAPAFAVMMTGETLWALGAAL